MLLIPPAPSTHGSSLKTSRFPPPSITARKIGPTFFRKALLSAVSSSLKGACCANSVTPTPISPILSKRFAWPSMMNLNKEGRLGSQWSVPTCPVAACSASRGTRSKLRPALVGKSFRKLWSTNWRIKPLVFLGGSKPHLPSSMLFW